MDKLENESWEDYAFRYNLYKIIYSDKEHRIIDDIHIPKHTILTKRNYDSFTYINKMGFSFLDYIMHELYILRNTYNLSNYQDIIYHTDFTMHRYSENILEQRQKDQKRQEWLLKELLFWETKYTEKEKNDKEKAKEQKIEDENKKKRYIELKLLISETCKEELEELIAIVKSTRSDPINYLEGTNIVYNKKDADERKEKDKKRRIELYQTYLKNIEIKSQIMELEEKINQLKNKIII